MMTMLRSVIHGSMRLYSSSSSSSPAAAIIASRMPISGSMPKTAALVNFER
jgi:hypothetical protein